jgi:hypothetical protein
MTLYIISFVSILLFLVSTHSPTIGNLGNLAYGFKPIGTPPSQPTSPPSNNLTTTPTTPQQQQFQPTSPPSNNLTTTPISPQQQQLQPLQQLPQTTPPVTKPIFPQQKPVRGPPASFQAKGTINSVISVPTTKWIATGNWLMTVNYGNLTAFATNMSWFDEKGTATHTHEFLNFRPGPLNSVIVQRPDNNVVIRGLLDVGTNHKVVWKNVPALVDIKGGKTITISVNDKATNNHFASQPILGVVKSFQRCSDVPGPDMIILPPCS